MNRVSPCEHCTRAVDPRLCEDKTCVRWRKWFTAQWEQTCRMYRQEGGKV